MVVCEIIYFDAYTNIFDTKIILHNYILYYGELSYIGLFTVDLGMPMIITDFQ